MNVHRPFEAAAVALPSRAFTLTEFMISLGLLGVLVTGIVASNLFGMRLMMIAQVKLGATGDARVTWARLGEEVRAAKLLRVGTGSSTSFSEPVAGAAQVGNAIEVYSTTNTSSFVRYFLDPADQCLKRAVNGSNSISVVASYVTNDIVFRAENHLGQPLTNNVNNRVLSVKLEFVQLQYPSATFRSNSLFDYYKLETRVTRRVLE